MKVIDKCKQLCEREMNKLQSAYDEAFGSYHDTGYDRYYNKMIKVEGQMDELRKFIDGDSIAKADAARYKRMYNEVKDNLFYIYKMMDNLDDNEDFTSPRVVQIINSLTRLRKII